MTRYRSVGVTLALAVLAACSGGGPPHPAGWSAAPGAAASWTTMSGAGAERYSYHSTASTGGLSDLASAQAVDTAQHYPGSRLLRSIPFPGCPGEAGLAEYSLPHGQLLEVAFAVNSGNAITVEYQRPKSVGEAQAAMTALKQAVCFSL